MLESNRAYRWLAKIGLIIAFAASVVLSAKQLLGTTLVGCGLDDACGRAASSVFGRLPIVEISTAYVGAAYFGAWVLLVFCKRSISNLLWLLAYIGIAGSILLVTVMFTSGFVCGWCLLVHIGNLLFVVAGTPSLISSRRDIVTSTSWAVAFGVILVTLVTTSSQVAKHSQEQKRQAAVQQISKMSMDTTTLEPGSPFIGRYPIGSSNARFRIVVFMDYQCIHCLSIERQAEELLASSNDISLSIKHFPLCAECNSTIQRSVTNPHPESCYAASIAEAMGSLGGPQAFLAVHRRLVENHGRMERDEMKSLVSNLGIDWEQFRTLAKSAHIHRLIQDDIAEAESLGLLSTPMVFINGVELKGILADNALKKSIEELRQSGTLDHSANEDRPPSAPEKMVLDWRDGQLHQLAKDEHQRSRGKLGAPIQVVLWGDCLDPQIAELDSRINRRMRSSELYYTFRHFPQSELSGAAALACEAAYQYAGVDGYWALHTWILEYQADFSPALLGKQLLQLNVPPQQFAKLMKSDAADAAVAEDRDAAEAMGLGRGPILFVNDRRVFRWKNNTTWVLESIFNTAEHEPRFSVQTRD